ncbi:MAG: hypothetical protein ACR2MQ_08930, partial [Gemmatimonadaceae bacterium]
MLKGITVCVIISVTVLGAASGKPAFRNTKLRPTSATTGSPAAQSCAATRTSLTPAGYRRLIPTTHAPRNSELRVVKELPLSGPPNRFDYQSFDPTTGRLWMNHMNAGETLVFSTDSDKVVQVITGVARATGILAVPSLHKTFVSAAG